MEKLLMYLMEIKQMDKQYQQGLITGLAMQPLHVSIQEKEKAHEIFCNILAMPGVKIDTVYCKQINFEEE